MATVRGRPELVAALNHVSYEIEMCVTAGAEHSRVNAVSGTQATILTNALLESHLTHARGIIEFLVLNPGHPNTIRRSSFAPKWKDSSEAAVRLEQLWTPLCEHLSHLSWGRLAPIGWDTRAVAVDVITVSEGWSAHLGAHDPQFGSMIDESVRKARDSLTAFAQVPFGVTGPTYSTTNSTTTSVHSITGPLGLST